MVNLGYYRGAVEKITAGIGDIDRIVREKAFLNVMTDAVDEVVEGPPC